MPSSALFLGVQEEKPPPDEPATARSRWVKINGGLLLDPQGNPRKLPPNTEITINLFPDTSYIGVIEEIREDGGAYTWIGHLKDVDMSELLIVYNAGLFLGHFASPGGVYEVSNAGGDLYLLIQIDQSKLPGGEGDIDIPKIQLD